MVCGHCWKCSATARPNCEDISPQKSLRLTCPGDTAIEVRELAGYA